MNLSAEQIKKRKRQASTGMVKRSKSEVEAFEVDEELLEKDEEGGEFEYESGDEGKGEGRWDKK
jgi:hypothetical protein